jgi:hypothetical protein
MSQFFYIVSLKHTARDDWYITLWRPKDKGYTYALSRAGKYTEEAVTEHRDYYHTGFADVAVPCEVLEALAIPPKPGHHDGDYGPVIASTKANWQAILKALPMPPKEKPQPQYPGARRRAA